MSKDLFLKMREEEVSHLLTEVEEGNKDALSTYGNFKRCKDLFEQASKQIEPLAQEEADLYSEKKFSVSGFNFEKRNGSTRYYFSHIPRIAELKKEIKEIEEKSKQAFISVQKGILVADQDGLEIELPKVTYTKDSLIVKNNT